MFHLNSKLMKESYKMHLQEVLKEGNVQLFREELHNVIKKEVKAMSIPLLARNEMLDMLELLEIPLNIWTSREGLSTSVSRMLAILSRWRSRIMAGVLQQQICHTVLIVSTGRMLREILQPEAAESDCQL